MAGSAIGVGVSPVWLHPEINNTNDITRINRPTVSTPTPTKAAPFNSSIHMTRPSHSDSPLTADPNRNRGSAATNSLQAKQNRTELLAFTLPIALRDHKPQQFQDNREKNDHQDYRENTQGERDNHFGRQFVGLLFS